MTIGDFSSALVNITTDYGKVGIHAKIGYRLVVKFIHSNVLCINNVMSKS